MSCNERRFFGVVILFAVTVLVFQVGVCADQATSAPGDGGDVEPNDAPKEVIKYQPVTPKQAAANRKRAIELAKKAKGVAPKMHLVETPHFLIFTEWAKDNDKPLREICERIYKAMCVQFDIPPEQNIWAGKCPIYIFWERNHYVRFCTALEKSAAATAAGFHAKRRGGFCYIVMNRAETRKRFYELLIHEATHAFLGRYLTNRRVPRWVNEGLADYMAATLVPQSHKEKRYKRATKKALRENRDLSYIFTGVSRGWFDYGIAQSLVRFMIARDRKAFVRFVRLIKEGKKQDEALRESYGATQEQLLRAWMQTARKTYHVAPAT